MSTLCPRTFETGTLDGESDHGESVYYCIKKKRVLIRFLYTVLGIGPPVCDHEISGQNVAEQQ